MNGDGTLEFCCILQICCGGHGERKAKATLADKLMTDAGLDRAAAEKAADWVLDHFDLAPKNSLKAYRDVVAKLARAFPYQEG